MENIDIERFRLVEPVKRAPRKPKRPPRHKHGDKFIKGPIPVAWLSKACCLPGSALNAAMALWFLVGIKQDRCVKLTSATCRLFGMDKSSKLRALVTLEQANLVTVQRKRGCSPIVTLLDIEAGEDSTT